MDLIETPENLIDKSEKFIGFYSKDGFWVDKRIDIENPDDVRKLFGIIPDIAISAEFKKFRAFVCVDGLILLRVEHLARTMPSIGDPRQLSDSLQWLESHLDYANALQLCIESESIKNSTSPEIISTSVLNSDTCRVGFIDGIPVNRSLENNRSLVAARHELIVWLSSGMPAQQHPQATSPAWMSWTVVPKSVIHSAIETFSLICGDENIIKWLSFISKAKTSHFNNDFRVAFVLLWFVIESAAKSLALKNGINARKIKTMELIAHELRLKNLINDEMFDNLTVLRKEVRNKLFHEPADTVCLPHHSVAAAKVAIDLVVRGRAIDLNTKWTTSAQF